MNSLKKLLYAGILLVFLLMIAGDQIKPVNLTMAFAQVNFPYQAGYPITQISGIEFASPSVIDIDMDGQLNILVGDKDSCVYAWNASGELLPGYPLAIFPQNDCSQSPRINGPLAIGDIDGDGMFEIVAGHEGTGTSAGARGRVFVWNHDGSLLPGWPKEMAWNTTGTSDGFPEVYTVALGNLAGDARFEILAGTSNNASNGGDPEIDTPYNLYVWDGSGNTLPGFPAYYRTAGIYGLLGAANIAGDGYDEVIVPRDHKFMNAYNGTGENPPGWPVEAIVDPSDSSVYVTFTRSAPSIGDLDHNGAVEIVMVGKAIDRNQNRLIVGSGILVVTASGQRFPGWESAKLAQPPLSDSFWPDMAPALADLDGDGRLEIVANLFDGTVRAYGFSGETRWVYDLAQGDILYPSEPVIGDITGDGELEVVFGAYAYDSRAYSRVGVYALDHDGVLLPGYPIHLTHEGAASKIGIRAAPTLADIDGDGDVEIVAGSWGGTLYVWDLSSSYSPARMPWPTARQNNLRNGYFYREPISYTHFVKLPLVFR